MQTPEDLGEAIRNERRAKGITQAHAAELAGVSLRLWGETERGERPQLGFETALRMLQTLGLDFMVASRASKATGRNE